MSQEKKKTPGRDERGRFTKENKIGEDTRFEKENAAACKYREKYADDLIEYFSGPSTRIEYNEVFNNNGQLIRRTPIVIPNDYPTFEGFAAKVGVTINTLYNWCEQSRRFANSYARAKEMQKTRLIDNTLKGFYNPVFAKMLAINDHGMAERVVNDTSVTFNVSLPEEIDEECN